MANDNLRYCSHCGLNTEHEFYELFGIPYGKCTRCDYAHPYPEFLEKVEEARDADTP